MSANRLTQVRSRRRSLNYQGFLGDSYAACVYCSAWRVNIECEFVAPVDGQKRPDLFCPGAGVYIECKSALSDLGIRGTDLDVIRKFQALVGDANTQFADIDPLQRFEHVIAVNMPEGVFARILAATDEVTERFIRKLFGVEFRTPAGVHVPGDPIIDNPMRVMMSDFDFGLHRDKTPEDWPREPRWLLPTLRGKCSNRLGRFLMDFLSLETL